MSISPTRCFGIVCKLAPPRRAANAAAQLDWRELDQRNLAGGILLIVGVSNNYPADLSTAAAFSRTIIEQPAGGKLFDESGGGRARRGFRDSKLKYLCVQDSMAELSEFELSGDFRSTEPSKSL